MNVKISVFIICVEAIIYLLLYNLHDCTFKELNYLCKHIKKIYQRQPRFYFYKFLYWVTRDVFPCEYR